ncbi:phage tail terminator protein [Oceaniglobus trochenteri]|uniref:phage tail terminator protein n=1 Tax=Oceaniglobus trochenteri TaxID=2763260 RepID=UPI001D00162D|nr:hypothetical protein [Oceaniglobus trochenteri]
MIELFVARLTANATALTTVAVAEDLDALANSTKAAHGTAFVVPWRERAMSNVRASGGHLQLVTVQIVVAFVVRHYNDAKGAERAAAFDTFKSSIEAALAGWSPRDESKGCALVGGEATALGDGTSIYAQTWETSRYLTGA